MAQGYKPDTIFVRPASKNSTLKYVIGRMYFDNGERYREAGIHTGGLGNQNWFNKAFRDSTRNIAVFIIEPVKC